MAAPQASILDVHLCWPTYGIPFAYGGSNSLVVEGWSTPMHGGPRMPPIDTLVV
jgi:hypothetical protein